MVVVQAARAERAEKEEQSNGESNGHNGTLSHPGQPFEASTNLKVPELAKTARAHAKKYTQGPPLVPTLIVDSILNYVQKARLRKMRECVEKICRYWSLKREARRGAPLLKRLYLEVSLRKERGQNSTLVSCFRLSHGQHQVRLESRLTPRK